MSRPRSWSKWVALAQWWYNTNYHTTHKRTPFEALFGYVPPIIPAVVHYSPSETSADQYLKDRQEAFLIIKKELTLANQRMKQLADRHRTERQFEEGAEVYLKVRRFQQHLFSPGPISKLSPKFYGPFRILARVGPVAYRLQLPEGVGLHPVFHVSLLKKSIGSADTASRTLPAPLDDIAPDGEPVAVLDKRVVYRNSAPLTQVLVQWSHLHPDHPTWEYLPDLLHRFPRLLSLL